MVQAIQKHFLSYFTASGNSLHHLLFRNVSNQLYPIFWAFDLQNPQCVKLKNFLRSWLVVELDTNTDKTDASHGTDPGFRLEPWSKAPWAVVQNTQISSGKRVCVCVYVCSLLNLVDVDFFSFHFPISVLRSWDLPTLAVLKVSNSHSW